MASDILTPVLEGPGGTYESFKTCVLELIPSQPTFIRRLLERQLAELGATEVMWRAEPKRQRSDNGRNYWFFLGEGQFHGNLFNEFHQAVLQLGSKHQGWTAGFNPAWMGGETWVFNFTVAALAL